MGTKKNTIAILVHGGAGFRQSSKKHLLKIKEAIQNGFLILSQGGTCLDAVESAIKILEDSALFNAGKGSLLQLDQRCRMDASIMEGHRLKAGAVAGIENVLNPIQMARLVMEKTPHVLMVGDGALKLARFYNLQKTFSPTHTSIERLEKTLQAKNPSTKLYRKIHAMETVGAVALDRSGNLAAGASTGGFSSMLPGRVGDSPLPGSGIYADNSTGAVSMTGWGEGIIRIGMAKEICCLIQDGLSPLKASKKSLKKLFNKIQGKAGAISLDTKGQFSLFHTTPYMCGGYQVEGKKLIVKKQFFQ